MVGHEKNEPGNLFFLSSKKTMPDARLCVNRQRNTPALYPQHIEITDSSAYTYNVQSNLQTFTASSHHQLEQQNNFNRVIHDELNTVYFGVGLLFFVP